MADEQTLSDEAQFDSGYDSSSTATPEPIAKPDNQQQAQAPAPVDPIKEIVARMDRQQAAYDKLTGSVGVLHQSFADIKKTLASGQAATKVVSDAPTNTQMQNAVADPQKWAALKAQHPEWAAATEEMADSRVKAREAEIYKIVSERVAGETAAVRSEVIDARLDSIVDGDWKAVVNSPEFAAWIETQTPEVQALGQSSKMTDAEKMLRLFEKSKQVKPTPAPTPAATARKGRIEAAVTPRGAGGHASSSTEMDEFEAGYRS